MSTHNNSHSSRNHRSHHRRDHSDRSRSRSPYRRSHDRKRRRTDSPESKPKPPTVLPHGAQHLSKHDYSKYKALFALYLDVQKQIQLEELSEREAKGRWKSFAGKWNRGDLATGYYDPATKAKADASAEAEDRSRHIERDEVHVERGRSTSDNDDDFGPALPAHIQQGSRAGPSIPNAQDLALAAEMRDEDAALARADLAFDRKQDRKTQRERLEELVPRADAGSRERQLEKKREIAATNRGFKDAKEGGDVEVGESELMGDDGVDGYKRRRKEMEKKKNEKELRREEQLRARQAEREERLQAAREKEAKTMDYLKALAKQRYG